MTSRLVAAMIALPLVLAAPAGAHTLGVAGAKRAAYRDAVKRAAAFTQLERPTILVDHCRRRSSHTVDCRVVYTFSTLRCRHITRVAFSGTGRRTHTRVLGAVACHQRTP